MSYNGRYILNEAGDPVPCPDLMVWARWVEEGGNRIVKQTTVNGHFVSTVFLALDYSFRGGMPMLFETMVWKEKDGEREEDIYQDRHSTRQKALLAHERIVSAIKYGNELK